MLGRIAGAREHGATNLGDGQEQPLADAARRVSELSRFETDAGAPDPTDITQP